MAKHDQANIIRTQFWVKSLLDAFEYNSVSKLAKLSELKWIENDSQNEKESFFSHVKKVCSDKKKAKAAYDLIISKPINESNWYKYQNGEQPKTNRIKNTYDAFTILVPSSVSIFENGKYDILAIIEANFVGDAVLYFKKAIDKFHEIHDLKYGAGGVISNLLQIGDMEEPDNLVGKQEFHGRFVKYFNYGDFRRAFESYVLLINSNHHKDFLCLDLAKKVIEVNFFSKNCSTLSNELHLKLEDLMNADGGITKEIRYKRCISRVPCTLSYFEQEYGIKKQLWIDSYRIFKYADNAYIKPTPLIA
jgi:hypothetical protein